jgi:asparagine synthetase B (glutamine-hydrolysing)
VLAVSVLRPPVFASQFKATIHLQVFANITSLPDGSLASIENAGNDEDGANGENAADDADAGAADDEDGANDDHGANAEEWSEW